MAYEEDDSPDSEAPDSEAPKSEDSPDSERRKNQYQEIGMPWWSCPLKPDSDDAREPHEILERLFQEIVDDNSDRYAAYRDYERLFGSSLNQDSYELNLPTALEQNELANTLETLHAQVFKQEIVPSVAVSEADYSEWFRAKAFSRWLEGVLDDAKVHATAFQKAGMAALVYGTGAVKVIADKCGDRGRISAVPVNPKYLFVDRFDARHGKPRNLFQKDHMDRYQLLEEFDCEDDCLYGDRDDRAAGIIGAAPNDDAEDMPVSTLLKCDMVTVKEAWHLPSAPGAKDGRHCIWIKGCTLLYEEFSDDDFPFIWIRWGSAQEGFWGQSAVRRLAGLQNLLDKLNNKIDESQDIMGVPRIIVRRGANITKAHITDMPGGILESDDINGIRDWNAASASAELYQDRDNAPRKMRGLIGVSDFEVQQQIPQGMRDVSGAFLERWVDQGQARHAMFHKQYQDAVVELAYKFMDAAAKLEEDGCEVVAKAPGSLKSSVEVLKFSEVKIDKERLKLRVLPMSQLPKTFAGKVEAIQKLKELMPEMDSRTVARLTEVPDVNGANDMLVSDEEIIMKNLDFMVKKKRKLPPLPNDNFDLTLQITSRFINCYRVKSDADINVVGVLYSYLADVIALQKGLGSPDENIPQPPGPPMPGGPPPMDPSQMPPPGPPGPMPQDGSMGAGPPNTGGPMPPMPPPEMPMQ